MPQFGSASLGRRTQLHPDLQAIADEAIKRIDFAIICGWRGPEEQERAFNERKSKLHYPDSKHNQRPSMAMDCVPWPVNWKNTEQFVALGAVIMAVGAQLLMEGKITHKLRWGHDWDGDGIRGEAGETDFPHYELV